MRPNAKACWDVAVVGAGAAGLMAAISAKKAGAARVLLLDSRNKIGAKILISGGTRCNVTNVRVSPSDYEGGPSHFVKHVLAAFTPDRTHEFFESLGVSLVLEPTGKYFPSTHSGKTVLDALIRGCEEAGVELKTGTRIVKIEKDGTIFRLYPEMVTEPIISKHVVLTTGGLSMPETGSDGKGFEIAKGMGHSVVPTSPSLTPLLTNDPLWQGLSGITLDVELILFLRGKKAKSVKGSFLFTHTGFSGPSVLDISRHWIRALKSDDPQIFINFIPGKSVEAWQEEARSFQSRHPRSQVKTFWVDTAKLPERLVAAFFEKINADPATPMEKIKKADLNRLVNLFYNFPLEVTGDMGYKKAEVTAGGVPLEEVSFSTMESKRTPGLYFAGEILDVDGRIGGFNFQWAWSSGAVAGKSAAKGTA